MKQKLLNKLWLRVGMIVAIMTTVLSGTVWAQSDTKTDVMFAKGFGGYTTSNYSAAGTDRSGVANSTNATGVTYAMQVFNGSTGAVRGNQSGASNFSCRNTTTYDGYYISSVSLEVNGGTLDGSTSGRSVVYFGASAYANPNTTAPSGTATTPSPQSSGQVTLTWTNTDENVSYFILYNLKTSGTALSSASTYPLTVVWKKKTAQTYTITAQSNNDSYGTVSLSGSVITASPASGYTYADPAYTVSPANSATVAQEGNEFTVTPTANTTVTINFEAIPTYTVTLGDDNTELEGTAAGAGVELPSRNNVGDYTFAGWSETNVTTETTTAPTIIPAGSYNPTGNVTLYPVYTRTEGGGGASAQNASVDISEYATANSWGSDSSTGQKSITLDSNVTATCNNGTNSGKYYNDGWRIYQTETGKVTISIESGELTSVTFTFTGNNGGILKYGGSTITTGTAVGVSGTSAEFTVGNSGSATNGQVRITAISVNYTISGGSTTYYWSSPVAAVVEQPVITVAENPFLFSTTATITCETAGATIYYTLDGSNPTTSSSVYSAAIPLTATTTIKAFAVLDTDESTVASVTATKNQATPTVTVSGDLTVDLAGETSVSAGTLTATVTYNDAAVAGATVTWSSSEPTIATIGENTGVVTLLSTGEVTFTATYAGDSNDYASATGTKTITVVDNDPYAITIWTEDFSSYNANDVPSGGTFGYSCEGTGTKIYDAVLAGGTTPELLVAKSGGTFTAVVPLNNASGTLTLTYKTNAKAMSVSTTTEGITGDGSFSTAGEHTVTFTGVTTSMTSITIVFTATSGDNVRLDDIVLTGRAEPAAVEAPTFSINGGTYYTAQTVELSCTTAGATIYYSTDDTNWTEYTQALTISNTTTLYAKAVKGVDESTHSSITITIAEKNDVVFNITDKTLAYGETYTITRSTSTGRDVQSDGNITITPSNAVATVSGTTITAAAVGTTTITLAVAEGDTYKSGSTTFTVTVTAPEGSSEAPVPTLFNETFDKCDGSGGHDNTFSGNIGTSATSNKLDESWATIGNNGAHQCIKLGTNNATGSVTTSEILLTGNGTLTFSAAGWESGTNTVSVTATGATLSGDTDVTMTNGEWSDYTVNIEDAEGTVAITFTMKRGFLDDVKVIEEGATAPTITATLNGSGYATFCSQYPLDFSTATDYTAWQISEVNGEKITFSQITGSIKGGTGILLKGTAGEPVELTSANSTNTLDDNLLEGTLAPTYVAANEYYGLSGNQFVKVNAGTVPAGKALLPASALGSNPVKAFTFVFEDDATGIEETLSNSPLKGENIYNLAGQKVNGKSVNGKLPKGIYIVNGKKVMVK